MMFLVICRRAPDGATDAFARLAAHEGAVLRARTLVRKRLPALTARGTGHVDFLAIVPP